MILPLFKSTKNIFPGCNLPRFITFAGSTGSAPDSEAITMVSSLVTQYLEGRSPFLSRVAPITFPSVKEIEAGPSQGSITQAWKA